MPSGALSLKLLVLALAGAFTGSACGHAPGEMSGSPSNSLAGAPITTGSEQTRAMGEYLVTLDSGTGVEAVTDAYGRFGIKSIKDLGAGLFHLTISDDPGPEKMEELRKQDDRIKAVQPNFVYRANRPAWRAQ